MKKIKPPYMEQSYHELHKGAMPIVFEYARNLRKTSTDAEGMLWERIRGRKLNGLKFRRQHPINVFIADFYCHEKRLIVEVDGNVHDIVEVKAKDEARTQYLNEIGVKVIRFTNEEVLSSLNNVILRMVEATKTI